MIAAGFGTMRANEKCRGDASTSHGVAHSWLRGTNMAIVSERPSSVQSCQICGGPSRNKHGCSKACRLKVKHVELKCHTCGETFYRNRNHHERKDRINTFCSKCSTYGRGGPKVEVPCCWCGKTLKRSQATYLAHKLSYCDLQCQSKHLVVLAGGPADGIRKCNVCGEPAAKKPNSRNYLDHCEEHRPAPTEYVKACGECGIEFVTDNANRKFCSTKCLGLSHRTPESVVACRWCDSPITIGGGNRWRLFCSAQCNNRHKKKIRRAREAGARVAPVSLARLARRDRFTCMLCGLPVDMLNEYPHPLSPTIDHIVPLSKGGEHSPSNTQLAHARCNISKGNRQGAV